MIYRETRVDSHRQNSNKLFVELIRFTPVVANLYLLAVMVCRLNGIHIEFLESLRLEASPVLLLSLICITGSTSLKFCPWHKVLSGSMLVYYLLMRLGNSGLFVDKFLYTGIAIIGLSLSIAAVLKFISLKLKL